MIPHNSHPESGSETASSGNASFEALMLLGSDLGSEALLTLTDEFFEDCPKRMGRFQDLIQANDIPTLHNEIHSFKSLCLTYGMIETGQIAQEIESALKTHPDQVDTQQFTSLSTAQSRELPEVLKQRDQAITRLSGSEGA